MSLACFAELSFTLPQQRPTINIQMGAAGNLFAEKLVLVTLNAPREKFWGAVLSLDPAGVSLRGVALNSLQDFAQLVKSGEAASATVVFFPMHRVERIELDARSGDLPSLAEQFAAKTGVDAVKFLQAEQE
jgi:hypothetical protein